MKNSLLPENLVHRILERLGQTAEVTPEGLGSLYAAWCQHISFDNVRKLIEIQTGGGRPLPRTDAEDFFEAWLKYGTGGTCWSGANACHALLSSLGFEATRGVGTMLVAPELPPNHGTVVVTIDDECYLLDCSILHGAPLRLEENASVAHRAWEVRCSRRHGQWHIAWRPLHLPSGLECRLERLDARQEEFASLYEATRPWSPFNYELTVRINRGDSVIGIAFGYAVSLHGDGSVSRAPINHQESVRLLVEDIGLAEEIVNQLPADTPTPPPPWSATALQAAHVATNPGEAIGSGDVDAKSSDAR